MNSTSSSGSTSGNEALIQQRSQLLAEQNRLRKIISKSKLIAESYEHDLQIAKTAFAFGESNVITRTKNIATMFGGMLRSDEELVDRIQKLMQQAEEDERTAEELRAQVEQLNSNRNQSDDRVDDLRRVLKQQKNALDKKIDEVAEVQANLESITQEIEKCERKKREMFASLEPISQAIGAKPDDPDFFEKLSQRANRMDTRTEDMLRDLRQLLRIDPTSGPFDAKKFFDTVAFKYEKLQAQANEQRELESGVKRKLETVKDQLAAKRKRKQELERAIRHMNRDIETTARIAKMQKQKMVDDMKNAEMLALTRAFKKASKEQPAPTAEALMKQLAAAVSQKVKALTDARRSNELRKLNSAQELAGGIKVVEDATNAISRANRHLLHKLRDPFVL